MAKKIIKRLKLLVPAGKATPAPPLGPALGQAGVNIQDFCVKFNAATSSMPDMKVLVRLVTFEDRTYDFKVQTSPATHYILKELGIAKGSQKPGTSRAGEITPEQLRRIAEAKMQDLNANSVEQAMKIIAGSARSMGIRVKDEA
jgi:large subunit ribosomal protein L11